jgi:hypothetical protein
MSNMCGLGYCPVCGAPGWLRERRPNGNDTCTNGHKYPSASCLQTPNNTGRKDNPMSSEPYQLLFDARELLGKAHDKIASAVMNHGGGHQPHLKGVCYDIEGLIDKLHDACGACEERTAK